MRQSPAPNAEQQSRPGLAERPPRSDPSAAIAPEADVGGEHARELIAVAGAHRTPPKRSASARFCSRERAERDCPDRSRSFAR